MVYTCEVRMWMQSFRFSRYTFKKARKKMGINTQKSSGSGSLWAKNFTRFLNVHLLIVEHCWWWCVSRLCSLSNSFVHIISTLMCVLNGSHQQICPPDGKQYNKIIIYLGICIVPSHFTTSHIHLAFRSKAFFTRSYHFCCFSFVSKSHFCFIYETIHQNSIRSSIYSCSHTFAVLYAVLMFSDGVYILPIALSHSTLSHWICQNLYM